MKLTNQIAHYIQACIIISSLLYSRSLASKSFISLYPLPFSSYSHIILPLAHRSSLSLVFLSVSYPPYGSFVFFHFLLSPILFIISDVIHGFFVTLPFLYPI